jgi:hypothetical protein
VTIGHRKKEEARKEFLGLSLEGRPGRTSATMKGSRVVLANSSLESSKDSLGWAEIGEWMQGHLNSSFPAYSF